MTKKFDSFSESEKKKKEQTHDTTEFLLKKQKLRNELEQKEKFSHLEELLEKGIISEQNMKNTDKFSQTEKQEIQKIIECITENHLLDAKNKILPAQLQISKQEYLDALQNPLKKKQLIQKLDTALSHIHQQISWWHTFINIFSYFQVFFLDKNVKKIQENYIDIKNNLLS